MALGKTLESRIAYRIRRGKGAVFMRQDFSDIGGYDQVGRILKQLVKKGILITLGYGLYARSRKSKVSGRTIPEKPLSELAQEALQKLRIPVAASSAEQAYNKGISNQIPTGRVVGVKGRISRKIGFDGKYIFFEKIA